MNEKEQTLTDLDLEDILKEFSGGEETPEETAPLEELEQEVSADEAEEPAPEAAAEELTVSILFTHFKNSATY